jgi:transposase
MVLSVRPRDVAGAARILADVGDVERFADRNRFASWAGTAPINKRVIGRRLCPERSVR